MISIIGFPIATNIPYDSSFLDSVNSCFVIIKGSPNITYNGVPIGSSSNYDLTLNINDHDFNFTFNPVAFNDNTLFDFEDLESGHYIVTLQSYVVNDYGNDYVNYWALGYLDYFPYSDTEPLKQFYCSSGYNTIKILNESNDNVNYYRFYFKGYSIDSSYNDIEDYNIISNGVNTYGLWSKYKPVRNNTFIYSNKDIYWGNDSSLYGFQGLNNTKFFSPSSNVVSVLNPVYNDIDSSDPVSDSNIFAVNNNVYNYGSTEPVVNNSNLYSYSGTSYGDIAPFYAIEEISGANVPGVDTKNWGVLDYVKHIPEQIANIPLGIINALVHLVVPSMDQFKELYQGFNEFAEEHLGVLNFPISFIINFIGELDTKYSENYSQYNFTIPGFRWFNMSTREKETLVQPTIIDLNTYFVNDQDWLHFWGTLRYLTSFLIYLNLIIMLFNKYKGIIGGDKVVINNYKPVGDIRE